MDGAESIDFLSAEEDEIPTTNQSEEEKIEKSSKRKKSEISPATTPIENKKSKTEISEQTQRMIYIKATNENLAAYAKKKPIAIKKALEAELGALDEIKITGEFVRIICKNQPQKTKAMKIKSLLDKAVIISEPFVMTNEDKKQDKMEQENQEVKGIIFGIPTDIDDSEIKEEIHAIWVKRLQRREGDLLIPTETVIFGLEADNLPSHVNIGCLSKRVSLYIPRPMRCTKCQQYGHRMHQCYSRMKCARCTGNHKYEDCPNQHEPRCANCQGSHSAGFRECPKYIEVQQTLQISVNEKMSYADALKQLKQTKKQTEVNIITSIDETANHGLAEVSHSSASGEHNNTKNRSSEHVTQTVATGIVNKGPGLGEVSLSSSSGSHGVKKSFREYATQTECTESTETEITITTDPGNNFQHFAMIVVKLLKKLKAPTNTIAEVIKAANNLIASEERTRKIST
jgi:hypothetical protein